MKRVLLLISIILSILLSQAAPVQTPPVRRDSIVVSLITCWPGKEIYELCGHSAIRVRSAETGGTGMDSVWNYGLFDFNAPNFVYRFVKGETDYMVAGYPFSFFTPEYILSDRKILEQDLDLTQEEAYRLLGLLRTESLPQNRVYRYNYVRDNCATRITDRLSEAVGKRIIFPDTLAFGSFRNEMRHFHRDYPWYQFGIDLALGAPLDSPVRPDEEMFVPVVMARRYDGARISDGRQLVRERRVLNEGSPRASLPATPWYLSPLFICSAASLLVIALCFAMVRRGKICRGLYSAWFLMLGLTGCLSAFLVFVSRHEATDPNLLILWINPLQLIIGLGVWWRSWRFPVTAMAWADILLLGILLLAWPFQTQSANPAFFPLMAATLALDIAYAILAYRLSYNNNRKIYKNEPNHRLGRRRTDGHKHGGGTYAGGKTASRSRNRR